MSDPSQNRPTPGNGQRGPNDPPGFNWKLAILLGGAFLILGLAYFSSGVGPSHQPMTYSEFRKGWDQGLVITDDPKFPLKVTTGDVPSNAIITGFTRPAPIRGAGEEPGSRRVIQATVQTEELAAILGESVVFRLVDEPAPEAGPETLVLSKAGLRRAAALGEIRPLDEKSSLIVHSLDGNLGVLVGVREIPADAASVAKAAESVPPKPFEVTAPLLMLGDDLGSLLKGSEGPTFKPNNDFLRSAIFTFLPVLLIVLLLFFLFRQQMKAAGRGAMSFGKSKARLLTRDHNKVTFKDVAGIQEAKEELWEIVDFLRDPRKFQKLGGSIPKGVLMVGPPGTGKTLLARAIAGEADVPFFSISGSDFVEMFVGVGASRVRDMFEQGKKHAPCLIFIDEIDAVGRHRGHGMGGGHDEREQTLNQLLVEMDGFDTQEGVIIIAATNRPDVLDPALLRPGRFDRQVTVSLPDVNGREEILRVHVKKIKLAPGSDLAVIARGTPGFSGAELANLINEAALLAARRGLLAVTLAEMEEARDKVRWGRERRSLAMSDKERIGTAWHEAGHAYLNIVLPHTHPLHKVTIIPRGPYLGATMYLPEGDKYSIQRKEALANLVVTMGGRIAESFVTDDVSNGASGDIRQATSLARHMVCEWGMSEKLGMIEYGDGDGPVFLAREMSRSRNYSEDTARVIDVEIKRFIDEAFDQASAMLTENKPTVELIANALLEFETLDGSQVRDLIEHGEMRNPPSAPKPPPVPEEVLKKDSPKPTGERPDENGPLAGEVVGAPA
ncbi:MAG: ATP-dependent zinc metalloprotease FtsH [Verrucomicrobia bacterium]|nr:MAG: ATP-dependent zinc metalloprotease FtsH [Verrucomicrobiota bacterium]TAE88638.1 MAG: ATP-dependent zinc metalloprotease FtsH [Verrucomicrobiota bacterium]TAF26440.1 MAG: ATP-dependent zinc metalloprotease FtsH [Verrucomicrobiota bacterium]